MTDTTIAAPAPSPAASQHPLMLFRGQPISREQAASRRVELMANSEYAQAAIKGDTAKQVELKDLWMLERGLEPSPPPATSPADVQVQSEDRAVMALEQHAAAQDQHFDLTQEQQHEILFQRPVTQAEKDYAVRELRKNMGNQEYYNRWRNGDRRARTEVYLLNAIKAMPLAHTLAQIEAWKAQHPFRGWDHA
jgi:hypothetical protein